MSQKIFTLNINYVNACTQTHMQEKAKWQSWGSDWSKLDLRPVEEGIPQNKKKKKNIWCARVAKT